MVGERTPYFDFDLEIGDLIISRVRTITPEPIDLLSPNSQWRSIVVGERILLDMCDLRLELDLESGTFVAKCPPTLMQYLVRAVTDENSTHF